MRTEVLDDDLRRVVAKTHVVERHLSGNLRNIRRILQALLLFRFIQKRKYTLGRCRHRLHQIDDLRDLLDRLREILDVLNERLNIADRNHAADRQQPAGQRHAGIAQIADKHHDRVHHPGEKLRLPR